MSRSALAVVVLLGVCVGLARGDELVLKNGGLIRGEIVEEGSDEVVIRLPDGNTLTVPRKNVTTIHRSSAQTPKPVPITAGRSAKLRWDLKPGEKLSYRSKSVWIFQLVNGPKTDDNTESSHDMTLEVVQVAADSYTLRFTLVRVVERQRENGKLEVVKDSKSKNPDEQPTGQGLVDVPVEFRLSTRGEILALTTFKGADLTEFKAEDRRGVERMVGENLLRFGLLSLLGTFPEESAKPGKASWKESALLVGPGMGDMTYRVTNTLRSFRGSTATIAQAGEVEMPGLARRKLKQSKITGELSFSRGRLKSAKQTMVMRQQPEDAKPNYLIDVTLRTTVELRKVKSPD